MKDFLLDNWPAVAVILVAVGLFVSAQHIKLTCTTTTDYEDWPATLTSTATYLTKSDTKCWAEWR